MTLEQRGAYHEMLCVSWQMGPLPTDHSLLSRLLGIDLETFERVWVEPLCGCWEKTELGLVNERLEQERKWAENRQEKAKKAGKASWNARSVQVQTQTEHDPEQDANSESTIQIQNQIQNQKKKEQKAGKPARLDVVRWEPKPTWEKDHPSLGVTRLIVDPKHLAALKADFPRVEGNGAGGGVDADIRKFKRHWLENPSEARLKRNWRKTLTNWLKRTDRRFDDARFKSQQTRAGPDALGLTGQCEYTNYTAEIADCEGEHGADIHKTANLITSGEKSLMRWCKHQCGFAERKT